VESKPAGKANSVQLLEASALGLLLHAVMLYLSLSAKRTPSQQNLGSDAGRQTNRTWLPNLISSRSRDSTATRLADYYGLTGTRGSEFRL
jgi:hypothetical protein